jgi:MarR family 2-MHQ and catechol resistance regulon transcriptional repressor
MDTTKQYGLKTGTALGLWVKLARVYETFLHRTAEDIRSYGLTPPQFAVLECIGHSGQMRLGDVTRKMLATGGNTTVVIDNLEKRGLVERIRDKKDRRVIFVTLTLKGKKLFKDIFPKHTELIVKLCSVLTHKEQKTLSDLLKKLGTSF